MTTVFIDGDDTLWHTQRHYNEAIDLFVQFCEKRGQDPKVVR